MLEMYVSEGSTGRPSLPITLEKPNTAKIDAMSINSCVESPITKRRVVVRRNRQPI